MGFKLKRVFKAVGGVVKAGLPFALPILGTMFPVTAALAQGVSAFTGGRKRGGEEAYNEETRTAAEVVAVDEEPEEWPEEEEE